MNRIRNLNHVTIHETIEEPRLRTEVGKSFANCLLLQTKRRLLHYESSTLARLVIVLDPRFKSIGFNSIENYDATVGCIREKLKGMVKELPKESSNNTADDGKKSNFAPKGISDKLFSKAPTAIPAKK